MADFDVMVIGGGPAGYSAALRAAELGGRVAVVEEQAAGGNCTNHACIPTAILLDTVDAGLAAQELSVLGVLEAGETLSWGRAAARKDRLVGALVNGISTLLRQRDVRLVHGRARFLSPGRVLVAGADGTRSEVTADAVVVATGARPEPPAIPGLRPEDVLTNDAALRLQEPPRSALILGGGPSGGLFGLEFAFLFAAFGCEVTLAEPGPALLPGADRTLAEAVAEAARGAGIRAITGAAPVEAGAAPGGYAIRLGGPDGEGGIAEDVTAGVVVAPDCRRPYAADLGLEAAGAAADGGRLPVDERCRTAAPGVYAAGDVTGGVMLSHVAAAQGRVAGENAAGGNARFDARFVPRVVYGQPELAWVGLTEDEARTAGRSVRVGLANLATNARAVAMGQREGLVKVVADAEIGQVLGVHVLGPQAGELIGQAVLALRLEATLEDLAEAVHWHPTLSESLAEAARRALP